MGGYGQYCPVARGAEIFAERWTPLIVRNLLLGCGSFNEIHAGLPRISRTLLTDRLRALERDGIVERRLDATGRTRRYHLTSAGEALRPVCDALGVWGARCLDLATDHLDPRVVLWGMCRFIDVGALPDRRVVVRFDLRDRPRLRFWLLAQRPEAEVCVRDPGFGEDVLVTTDCEWLARWHMGWISLREARRQGVVHVTGPRELVRLLSAWGGLSPFASVRPADAGAVERPIRAGSRAIALEAQVPRTEP